MVILKQKEMISTMAKLKVRRAARNHTTHLIAGGVIIVLAIVAFIIFSPSTQQTQEGIVEVTETDIFSIQELDGKNVSVKGVMVGMTKDKAIEALGFPDKEYIIVDNARNLEFGTSLGLTEPGIIVQVIGDIITKITLKPAFNEYLHGDTKISRTKQDILLSLGAPKEVKMVPWSENSARVITLLTYKEKHLQFGIYRNQQLSLSFII